MVNRSSTVGVFVLAGLALFSFGIFLVGDRHQAFAKHIEFYSEFRDVSGLSRGVKVRVGGMDAGEVVGIEVPDSPATGFRVQLRVDQKLRSLIRTDSVASIQTAGIVGDQFVLIHPGTPSAPEAPELARLPSKEPLDMYSLLDQGQGLLNDAESTLKEVRGNLDTINGKVVTALDATTTAVSNVNDLLVGLKQGRGAAGMLLEDDSVAASVRQSLANAQEASANLKEVSGQVKTMVVDLQSRQLPQGAAETMESIKSAASKIDEASKQLDQVVVELAKPNKDGVDAATNIREALANVNASTANLVDDSEALKHNFLLKGFFRRRGYYNLGDMSPVKYREDKVFQNPHSYRAWLSAAELFQIRSNGVEEISAQGKALLDGALIGFGDSATESPIVIEGYEDAGNAADQLAQGRKRAILVRQYLQAHFAIDSKNLGIVSLRSSPPSSVGRDRWNGICLVILRGHP